MAKRKRMDSASGPRVAIYQTRVRDYWDTDRLAGDAALADYGALYGKVQRKLFSAVAAGRSAPSLKNDYLRLHQIPARMFNAVRVSLDGKIQSVKELQPLRVEELEHSIARAEKQIEEAREKGNEHQVHYKTRRLANLRWRLETLQADLEDGKVRITFGSRRLWCKRNNLEANGYEPHAEWLADWQSARSDEFFVLGSRDETAGCQLCTATVADDGTLSLRLRLPNALSEQHGKYLHITGVKFAYGHEQVLAALQSNTDYGAHRRQHGAKAARATSLGQAISYRFKRDAKGWRVFVSTQMMDVPVVTDQRLGTVGVDLNTDYLAVTETDASGNYINAFSVAVVTHGKSNHQSEALIGDAVARVVAYAREAGKPIAIEKLNFQQKKAALEGESRKYSRTLSGFGYSKIKAYFLSRGYRNGVDVRQVNPAYSSFIGLVKFSERYGLSIHQAVALVLARRLLGCSERIPRRRACPLGNGDHVTFYVPVRKRVKHVWTYWGAISRQLRPALAAHHRQGKRQRRPQSGSG